MINLKFIDLFAGIGGTRLGFENHFTDCVFSSEIDHYAKITYKKNFGYEPYGDITQINELDIPNFDILLAGFPCQPFSNAGLKKGFEDIRGTLFFHIIRIAIYHKPKVIFLENVKGLKNHKREKLLKPLNIHCKKLDTKFFQKYLIPKIMEYLKIGKEFILLPF